MDTTQTPPPVGEGDATEEVDALLERLGTSDPAEAAPLAEEVAARLADALDAVTDDRPGREGGTR